jgi:hypothetical protein
VNQVRLFAARFHGIEFESCFWRSSRNRHLHRPLAVYCRFPGYLANGRLMLVGHMGMYDYRPYVRKVMHGRQIAFECQKGFYLNGPTGSTCLNGVWSPSNLPQCLPNSYHSASLGDSLSNVWLRRRRRKIASQTPRDSAPSPLSTDLNFTSGKLSVDAFASFALDAICTRSKFAKSPTNEHTQIHSTAASLSHSFTHTHTPTHTHAHKHSRRINTRTFRVVIRLAFFLISFHFISTTVAALSLLSSCLRVHFVPNQRQEARKSVSCASINTRLHDSLDSKVTRSRLFELKTPNAFAFRDLIEPNAFIYTENYEIDRADFDFCS